MMKQASYWEIKLKPKPQPTDVPFPHNKITLKLDEGKSMFQSLLNKFRTRNQKILHQQKIAAKVVEGLKSLPGLVETPIVSGGAARDWLLDRIAADVDIFIHTKLTMGTIKEQFRALGIKAAVKTGQSLTGCSKTQTEDYPEEMELNNTQRGIIGVFESHIKGVQVQFIFINQPLKEYIYSFPIDICMVSWADGKFHPTDKFMSAINTGVLTLWNPCKPRYVEKIKAKFPEFEFVDKSHAALSIKKKITENPSFKLPSWAEKVKIKCFGSGGGGSGVNYKTFCSSGGTGGSGNINSVPYLDNIPYNPNPILKKPTVYKCLDKDDMEDDEWTRTVPPPSGLLPKSYQVIKDDYSWKSNY